MIPRKPRPPRKPHVKLEHNCDAKHDDACSICTESMPDAHCQLPCKHCFHADCILTWANQHARKCPLCRSQIALGKRRRIVL